MKAKIDVYISVETADNLKINDYSSMYAIADRETEKIGNFTILPFKVKHDVPCLGFLIHHEETGTILFATDTYYLPNKFANLTNILIECNYRQDILDRNIKTGRLSTSLTNRTLESHMSFDTCREALLANDLSKVNNIVLIHLSDGNSNAAEFQRDIQKATGKNVFVAEKGLKIQFDKTPF